MKLLGALSGLLSLATATHFDAAGPHDLLDARSSITSTSLRILPLGASITFGSHSTDGNGYRLDLKELLGYYNVQYIGTQCSGTMQNGNNEGHPGDLISQMWGFAQSDLSQYPNVVLLYVGTNDMLYPYMPATAPQRMATLVQQLATRLPKTLIVVGNLFLELTPAVQARINTYNAALPGALAPLQQKGVNVVIADFSHALTASDLYCDGEHPNDTGYAKMAGVFYRTLVAANSAGKIHGPYAGTRNGTVCKPLPPPLPSTCTSSTTSKSSTSTPSSSPTNTSLATITTASTTTAAAPTTTQTTQPTR